MVKMEAEHGVLFNCNGERTTGEEKRFVFLFLIVQQERDMFNTITWEKKRNADGNPTDEDDITVRQLFKNF